MNPVEYISSSAIINIRYPVILILVYPAFSSSRRVLSGLSTPCHQHNHNKSKCNSRHIHILVHSVASPIFNPTSISEVMGAQEIPTTGIEIQALVSSWISSSCNSPISWVISSTRRSISLESMRSSVVNCWEYVKRFSSNVNVFSV